MNLKIVFSVILLLILITTIIPISSFLLALLVMLKVGLILFIFMELIHADRFILSLISFFILTGTFILVLI